jgi:hypothetical protein
MQPSGAHGQILQTATAALEGHTAATRPATLLQESKKHDDKLSA